MQKETIRLELIDRLCLILNLINNVRSAIEQPELSQSNQFKMLI